MVFTQGSYNAQKAARLAFRDTCRRVSGNTDAQLSQRVWNWRITKAMKDGAIGPAPTVKARDGIERSQWYKVDWALPRMEEIDRAKEVSGESAGWSAGLLSLRDTHDDPYGVLRDKAEDIQRADAEAVWLNRRLKTGKVTWQHLINAGVPGMTVQPQQDDPKTGADDKDMPPEDKENADETE
jgi:capsid protein